MTDPLTLDTQAFSVQQRLDQGLFPDAERETWKGLMNEYRAKVQAEGRQPFSAYTAHQSERNARVRTLFATPDVAALQTKYVGKDVIGHKQRTANIAYLAQSTGRSTRDVGKLYPMLRDAYAKSQAGKDTLTDSEMFSHVASTFELEKAIDSAAVESAMKGVPAAQAWGPVLAGQRGHAGWNAAKERDYAKRFWQVSHNLREDVQELQPIANEAVKSLQLRNSTTDLFPVLEKMRGLDDAKLNVLYELMAQQAKPVDGTGEQLGQQYHRASLDYINSLDRGAYRSALDDAEKIFQKGVEVPEGMNDMRQIVDYVARQGSYYANAGTPEERKLSKHRILSKEELEQAKTTVQEMRGDLRTLSKLEQFANERLNPIEGGNAFMKYMALPAVGSLPVTLAAATGSVGLVANSRYYEEQEYNRLLDAGTSHEDASRSALAVGVMQSAVEKVQVGFLAGKLPGVKRIMDAFGRPGGSMAARGAGYLAGATTLETGTELVQDYIIPALVQDITQIGGDVAWLSKDGPLMTAAKAAPETAAAVFLFGLVGSGVATVRDAQITNEMAGSVPLLMQTGFSQEQAATISSQPDLHDRVAKMRELWKDRQGTAKTMQEAATAVQKESKTMQEAEAKAETLGVIPRIGRTENAFTLRFEDGSITEFPTFDEARNARVEYLTQRNTSEEAVYGNLASQIQYFERTQQAGEEFAADSVDQAMTVEDMAELKPEQAESVFERLRIENALNGTDAQASEQYILGTSNSETVDGIYRTATQYLRGATALTVVEEKVEGDARRMIAGGMGDKLRGWIRDAERPGNKMLADDTDQSLVEGFSRAVTAYALNNRKELQKLGLDVIGMKNLGAGLKGVLRNYRTFFGEVFKRALALRKSKQEGKLAPEFEQVLRKSLGISEQTAYEADVIQESIGLVDAKTSFALGDPTLKAAEQFLRENVVNKPLTTKDGLTATVSNTTASKMISGSAVKKSNSVGAHLAAIADFENLFQTGVTAESKADRADSPDIVAIHRVHSPMSYGNKNLTVKFTVKEIARGGNRIYSIEAMDLDATTPAGQLNRGTETELREFPIAGVIEGNNNSAAEKDQAYLDAVEKGDLDAAAVMVQDAAKAAGYTIGPVYHATDADIEAFNPDKTEVWGEFWFADQPDPKMLQKNKVIPAFLKIERPNKSVGAVRQRRLALRDPAEEMDYKSLRGDAANESASKVPFDGVIYEGNFKGAGADSGNAFLVFNPSNIKSAETITKDKDGNIIPLSQRFNSSTDKLSYSTVSAEQFAALEAAFDRMDRDPDARRERMLAAQRKFSRSVNEMRDVAASRQTEETRIEERNTELTDLLKELEANQDWSVADLRKAQEQAFISREQEQDQNLAELEHNLDEAKADLQEAVENKNVEIGGALQEGTSARKVAQLRERLEKDITSKRSAVAAAEKSLTKSKEQAKADLEALQKKQSNDRDRFVRGKTLERERAARTRERDIARDKESSGRQVEGAALLAALRTQDALLLSLPSEIRGRLGGAAKLATLPTDAARLKLLVHRAERADVELEKWLRKEADGVLKKLFAKVQPAKDEAGKKRVGKAGADVHALFDTLQDAVEWDAAAVDAYIVGLESAIAAGDMTAEQESHAQLEIGLVGLLGDWKNADAERRFEAVQEAKRVWQSGYADYRLKKLQQKEDRDIARAALRQDTGKAGTRAEREAKMLADNNLTGRWKESLLGLLNFEQVLGHVFGDTSAESRRLADMERSASSRKDDAITSRQIAVEDLFTRLAGGKLLAGEKLRWDMAQKSITVQGEQFSQMEAVAATLMWRQEDGRRHMEGTRDENNKVTSSWSYDQAFVDELEASLTPEAKAVRAHLVSEYAGEYARLNPIYRELNGINLPQNSNYSPITVKPVQAAAGQTVDPVTGGTMSSGSTTPGALRTRSRNAIAEPDFRDALQTFIAHTKQMEHWMAYAPLVSEAQAILGNRDVGNSVQAKAGEQAVSVLRGWIDVFGQGGTRDAAAHLSINQALGRAANRAASIALVGRLGTIAVQSTQLGAALAQMPTGSYLKRFGKLMLSPDGWKMWRESFNSPYIQRRLQQMPPVVRQAVEGMRSAKPNRVKHLVAQMGTILGGADALFTAGTYAMVYDYQMTQATQAGLFGQQAIEYATSNTERAVDRVAQPTRPGARSLFENRATSPIYRLAWAFASDARKNFGLAAYALAQRPAAEKARTLAFVLLINTVMATIIRTAWKDARDDEDEEIFDERNWSPSRIALSVSTDWMGGVPVFGEVAQSMAFKAAGEYHPEGGLFSTAGGAPAAAWRLVTNAAVGELEADQSIKDVESILSGMGLFNDSIAAAASFSHLARDLFGVADNVEGKD